jgi:gliding motility-associated-like protein
MKFLKSVIKCVSGLMLAFCLLFSQNAKADHLAAMDIYYDYVAPLTYDVHLIIYRDCAGIPMSSTQTGCASSVSTGQSVNFVFDTTGTGLEQEVESSNWCPSIQTNCQVSGSVYNSFQRWHYLAQVVLPNVASDWIFVWNSCCRTTGLLNVGYVGMAVEARLNNIARPINNSPRLTEEPVPSLCLNQVSQFLNAPVDPDNDSVFFELATPLEGGSLCGVQNPVTFIGGYTEQQPLASANNVIRLNSLSGTLCLVPTMLGQSALAFRCWDIDRYTGDTLGSITRDVQITVTNCFGTFTKVCDTNANIVPTNSQLEVCPGTQIVIYDTAYSTSLANVVIVSSNNAVTAPGSTWVTPGPTGIGQHSGIFTWTPTQADAGIHQLIIKYQDSTCNAFTPIMFPVYHTYQISVLDGVSVPPSYSFCLNGDSLNLSAIGPPAMNQWSWTILPGQSLPAGATPNFSSANAKQTKAYPTHTMYIQVEGGPPIGNCPNKDTTILQVFPEIIFTQTSAPYNPCANEPVTLDVTNNNLGGQWLWTPATYLNSSTIINPICTPIADITYSLKYIAPNLCQVTKPVAVTTKGIKPFLSAVSSKNPVCANEAFDLLSTAAAQPCGPSNTPSQSGAPTQYVAIGSENIINTTFSPFIRDWYAGYRNQYLYSAAELRAMGLKPGNISALAFRVLQDGAGPTEDTLKQFKIKLGCTQIQNLSASAGFIGGLSDVFTASKYAPFTGVNTFNFMNGYKHFWDGSSNLVVEVCYNIPGNVGNTTAEVSCSNTPFQSAMASQDWSGGGCMIVAATWNTAVGSIRPNAIFHFQDVLPLTYSWVPTSSVNNPALPNPTVVNGIPNQTTFNVVSYGGTPACASTANVVVSVDFAGSVDATASALTLCYPGYDTLKAIPNAAAPTYKCGDNDYTPNGVPIVYTAGAPSIPANFSAISNSGPFPYNNARMQYIITAGELQAGGLAANIAHRLDAISFEVVNKFTSDPYIGYTIKLACISNTLNELSSFREMAMTTVYNSPAYNTLPGWNIFNLTPAYLWNGKDNLLVEVCFDSHAGFTSDETRMTAGTYPNNVMVNAINWTGGSGCNTTGGFGDPYRPSTRFIATVLNPKSFQYGWQPSLYAYDSSAQNTLTYIPASGTYTVFMINNNGCKRYDSISIKLIEHDVEVSPKDTEVCVGDQFYARAIGSGTGKQPTYAWTPTVGIESPTSPLTFVDAPNPPPVYFVVRTDEYGCKDTAELKVKFRLPPPITINGGLDTLIVPYDLEANLVATGGTQTYSWTPSWAVSNSNIANPIIQPKQSGLYYVYGVDSASCKGYDSIYVKVDETNPVVMPNAFTPNADGDNDLFKPWSVRKTLFEEVQQFKVLNRWGQEVYDGTSQSAGWDGTYKGMDCEMDTYYYTITLAYPNGSVKQMKGEVLLIR